MSDAYVCDRCDSLGKGDPAARIVQKDDGPGSLQRTTEKVDRGGGSDFLNDLGRSQRDFGPSQRKRRVITTSVEWVDLCPDCAVEFEEWWDGREREDTGRDGHESGTGADQ